MDMAGPPDSVLLQRARDIVPMLRDKCLEVDRDRRVHQETIDALLDAGILQMLAPRRYGGSEAAMSTFFETAVTLATGDGSVAWLFGILGSHHWVLAHFPIETQDALYGGRNHMLFPLTFSGKGGTAVEADGGYRVTGNWGFASGIDFADWVGGMAVVEGSDPPVMLNVLMPKSEVEVIDDWFVAGMRGTGSRQFRARDLFVPASMILPQADLMAGRTPGAQALSHYQQLKVALHTVFSVGPIGAALGLARRAIDEFVAFSKGRVGYGGIDHSARVGIQIKIGDCMARWDAFYNLMQRHFLEIDHQVAKGRPLDAEQKLRYRRDATLAVEESMRIVDILVTAAGARAQHESSPFQLIQRDIHTVRTHVLLDRDEANEFYGKHVLGIDLGPVRQ